MDRIVLASGSPRRQEILRQMGIDFILSPQDVDESFGELHADQEAVRLAKKKVLACMESPEADGIRVDSSWILGADTFIEFEGEYMGKASNRDEAGRMLARLSGKTHSVITGLALHVPAEAGGGIKTAFRRTLVNFSAISPDEIEWYLDTGEWHGVAAAYRIQEKAAVFIDSITGSWSNVMGLPINTFYGMLRSNKFNFRD